jgi:SAM-dependent methyltransferase
LGHVLPLGARCAEIGCSPVILAAVLGERNEIIPGIEYRAVEYCRIEYRHAILCAVHDTAMKHGRLFFDAYLRDPTGLRIVEIGSQDVNGSLRSVAPKDCEYAGLDFQAGRGVDLVLDDPYSLPLPDNFADVCVSSSCLEHSEFFWLAFLEMARIVKPSGLIYLNVPSNGEFHRYPVDCWRFYPDSGIALQNWARRNGFQTTLLESFVGNQQGEAWNDFIAVFANDQTPRHGRILDNYRNYTNGWANGTFTNLSSATEDQRKRRLFRWR